MPKLNSPLQALDPALGWINAPVHVHELAGHPVLLHFWSVHCESCLNDMPQLHALLERYLARGLKVIGVHVPLHEADLDTQQVEEHVQALHLHHPIAVDDSSTIRSITLSHDVRAVPAFLVYDRDGRLRHYSSGPQALGNLEYALERVVAGQEEHASAPA
jgi:thiol-disulfide isomerase/thioredoxin